MAYRVSESERMSHVNEINALYGPPHRITPENIVDYCEDNDLYYDIESEIHEHFVDVQSVRSRYANDEETRTDANNMIMQFNSFIRRCDTYMGIYNSDDAYSDGGYSDDNHNDDNHSEASTIVENNGLHINIPQNSENINDCMETPSPITPAPSSPIIAPEWINAHQRAPLSYSDYISRTSEVFAQPETQTQAQLHHITGDFESPPSPILDGFIDTEEENQDTSELRSFPYYLAESHSPVPFYQMALTL